jgi:tetratricopeptide (TPR) repeat protein
MGDLDLALSTYQRNLSVSENLGDELNCADVLNNLAYIHIQQDNLDKAMEYFQDARQIYNRYHDTLSVAQCDNNTSNIYVQWQQYDEAMALLKQAIPVFEQNEDEASLAHAYQNLGAIYATGHVNMDSALVYLNKSIVCAKHVGDQITLIEDELELAGVLRHLGKEKDAISLYQSALHSSETMGYVIGMLEAYKNLGIHYNETGDFTTSAVYLKRCMDLASEKGNQLYVNTVRPYLIADYARLGQLMEMKRELGLMRDDYLGIVNENSALSDELSRIQYNVEGLLGQYESQNEQIQTFQSQRDHYRLAFFGLLAIELFAVALLVAYKIVRKNRVKTKKS